MRRHDVDWLRILALGLLIFYHIAVIFQPFAHYIYFIQSQKSVGEIWLFMGLINIWRIPLLFIISGMGVCFAMRRRTWKELLMDRTKRIFVPLLFGSLLIVPIHGFIYQSFNRLDYGYYPNAGHLWFLGNIFFYVLILCPFFYFFKNNPNNILIKLVKQAMKFPPILYLITLPFILEAEWIAPEYYSNYAYSPHGFWLGMMAFITGFLFISIGDDFWKAVEKIKWYSLAIAFVLYLIRLVQFQFEGPFSLTVVESWSWLFTVFGFGTTYLNQPSKTLSYLSKAVYPVYILHMIFMNLSAHLALTQPDGTKMAWTMTSIEVDGPAEKAELKIGNQLFSWDKSKIKPNEETEFFMHIEDGVKSIKLTPDGQGKLGAEFSPMPTIVPRYTAENISTGYAFLNFIIISVLTFMGCFLGYEMVKRINWLRPLFGIKPVSIRK